MWISKCFRVLFWILRIQIMGNAYPDSGNLALDLPYADVVADTSCIHLVLDLPYADMVADTSCIHLVLDLPYAGVVGG